MEDERGATLECQMARLLLLKRSVLWFVSAFVILREGRPALDINNYNCPKTRKSLAITWCSQIDEEICDQLGLNS